MIAHEAAFRGALFRERVASLNLSLPANSPPNVGLKNEPSAAKSETPPKARVIFVVAISLRAAKTSVNSSPLRMTSDVG
jgi:hypothetical protein